LKTAKEKEGARLLLLHKNERKGNGWRKIFIHAKKKKIVTHFEYKKEEIKSTKPHITN